VLAALKHALQAFSPTVISPTTATSQQVSTSSSLKSANDDARSASGAIPDVRRSKETERYEAVAHQFTHRCRPVMRLDEGLPGIREALGGFRLVHDRGHVPGGDADIRRGPDLALVIRTQQPVDLSRALRATMSRNASAMPGLCALSWIFAP
jgi:hypothetical protein